ncbi:two-component system, OmpR family, sensor histidine kinase VanS [Plantibacter sp. VKM Ac-1784]|uniref:histidine kinase n=1 Tax=Plantibacter elymi (nom. nud.) TaxID=199708 RepID=A0ABY1RGM2_9MICO|nr:HAMP domain-containing sensor histidine kinase [Plantibacter sp. VKM Ac-1784]SMQ73186.1 two-component system, OmpR family, sensor histidine kinase VanS [Plantibacter sp. VKM Ac-1784]
MTAAPAIGDNARPTWMTARVKLTATYAAFTVMTGLIALIVINVIIWRFPSYPLAPAGDSRQIYAISRGEIRDSLINYSMLALIAMAVIGTGVGWIVAGRVLRPLRDLNAAVRAAAEGSLDHRIAMTGRRDEFRELADRFDDMLARLEQSFLTQKRFAANASHELRTPLATMKMLIEVAQADPEGRDVDRALRRLHETNERGIAIVEALLQLNQLDRRPLVTSPVDLASVARDASQLISPEAADAGITISSTLRSSSVRGNRVLLQQLLTNLLSNAVRYNRGADGWVSVWVGPDPHAPGRAVVVVSNSGPLLDEAEVARFVEPFDRRDARMARAAGRDRGNGLGLTLGARIVELHGGSLRLAPLPAGGLEVTVLLPAHDADPAGV